MCAMPHCTSLINFKPKVKGIPNDHIFVTIASFMNQAGTKIRFCFLEKNIASCRYSNQPNLWCCRGFLMSLHPY